MTKFINSLNKLFLFSTLILCLTMMNYRSLLVDKIFGVYTSCDNCYWQSVLNSDATIFLLLAIVIYLGFTLKHYFLRLVLKLTSTVFIIYYLIDVYIFKFLYQRLYFADIFKYFDLNIILESLDRITNNHTILFLILVLIILIFYLFIHKPMKLNKTDHFLTLIIISPLIYFIFNQSKIDYVNDIYLRNIIEINYKAKESNQYSQQLKQDALTQINSIEELSCTNSGLNQKKNIILLVVESLSSYQSKLHSGLNDWTPNLDQIARNHTYFSNFFANNFTSLEGRIALLTGEKTFRGMKNFSKRGYGRTGYWNTQRNLPKLMNQYGYHTSFLDGANLGFSKTGNYMNGIGFDYVEGSEYNGYKNKPRYSFNSVSDMDLYDRVINFINEVDKPFFTTIITVTTHPPYYSPDTGQKSIEQATKYADKSVLNFYNSLRKNNFFDNGLLIITSDHRSMTPVSNDELIKFEKQAVSRIPLILIDSNTHKSIVNTEYLQQSDLLNSLEYYISDNHCSRKDEGNLFTQPPKAAACVYHSRGDYRERVDVYCNNGSEQATIELNGDDTSIIEGSLIDKSKILNLINYSRIGANIRHQNYVKETKK